MTTLNDLVNAAQGKNRSFIFTLSECLLTIAKTGQHLLNGVHIQKMNQVHEKNSEGGELMDTKVSANCTYDEDILAFRKHIHSLVENIFSTDDMNNPSSVGYQNINHIKLMINILCPLYHLKCSLLIISCLQIS